MMSLSGTTSIEAGQAHIQPGGIVNGVKTLGAIFSVYGLICSRGNQMGRVHMRACHVVGSCSMQSWSGEMLAKEGEALRDRCFYMR